jgi:hypothetical protein
MATMPTVAQWVDAWQALTIAGVTVLATPPLSLSTAQLPAAWPELPGSAQNTLMVSCVNENKARRMVFQVAIEPIGQVTQAGNYEAVIPFFDLLETALEGMRGVTVNFLDYDISMVADIQVGKVVYWGLRVDATGRNVR